jgi:hypothetical protein
MELPRPEIAARIVTFAKLAESHATPEDIAAARADLLDEMGLYGTTPIATLARLLEAGRATHSTMARACFCKATVDLLAEAGTEADTREFDGDLLDGEIEAPSAAAALLPELADDRHRENLIGVARKVFTQAQLDAACVAHREWMREHPESGHGGDAMKAADVRLRAMNTQPGNTLDARALIIYAAATIQDEGRLNRGDVPTMDAPAGDVGTKGKGKRRGQRGAKSSTGPKKSKRATGFVKRIGTSGAGFKASFGPDDERLLEMLRKGGFRKRAEEIKKDPAWGFCPLDDATGSTAEIASLPTIGSDPDFVVFGLRRDAKTGCPTFRFRADAERQATEKARGEGKENATGAAIKEITEDLVNAWYAKATPTTQLIPCAWQRSAMTLWVFSDNADAQTRAVELAGATLGKLDRRPGLLDGLPTDLHKTNLRSTDGAENGTADPAADLLLWLVGKDMAGLGRTRVGVDALPSDPKAEGELEFWLEDEITLTRPGGELKKLGITLRGAAAEGGSLATALADGATIGSARITLKFGEVRWSLTLGAGASVNAWKLQCETKPDGTPRGLDTAIDERLRLWRRGSDLLDVLVTAYRTQRIDKGNWRQGVAAVQRKVHEGLVEAERRFREGVQLPLFAQADLDAITAGNAEPTKPAKAPRGRKARDEAAANGAEVGGMP